MRIKDFHEIDVHFLYFIITRNNFVKIGFTRDIKRRINELRPSFPGEFVGCKYIKFVSREEAEEFEKLCHKQFSAFRVFGEWFEFPDFIKFSEMNILFINRGEDYYNAIQKVLVLDISEYDEGDYFG